MNAADHYRDAVKAVKKAERAARDAGWRDAELNREWQRRRGEAETWAREAKRQR